VRDKNFTLGEMDMRPIVTFALTFLAAIAAFQPLSVHAQTSTSSQVVSGQVVSGQVVPAAITLTSLTGSFHDTRVGRPISGRIDAKGEAGTPLSFTVSIAPTHGRVTLAGAGQDGWTYRPNRGFVGPDRFEITVSQGTKTSKTKVVVLTNIAPTNRTYYVEAGRGSDTNRGTRESQPLATIQAAADRAGPGDTILIKNGTYLEANDEAVAHIRRSGAPGAPITFKAFPGHKPVLSVTRSWNHVLITGSYIRVEGLTVRGNADKIDIAQSNAVYERFLDPAKRTWGPETSFVNTNGIFVRPENSTAPAFEQFTPRHIEIIGNHVSHVPGGGIATDMADYIIIANNVVHDNAYRSVFANSGISIFHPQDTDGNYTDYKNIIKNNVAYRNRVEVKWWVLKRLSDGNGIIVDDTDNSQIKGIPYKGRSLIANNIAFENGGAGVQSYSSQNVDVFYNTLYRNTLTPELNWGQIVMRVTKNGRVMNNIVVTEPGERPNEADRTTNVVYDYNLYFGTEIPPVMGPNDIIADPKFVDVSNADKLGLRLAPGSPAANSGTPIAGIDRDLTGGPRVLGTGPDRGAFEGP
jgi:Bacterial Ig domain/Right handed beta helix region